MKRVSFILPESEKVKFGEEVTDKTLPMKNVLNACVAIAQSQEQGFNYVRVRQALKIMDKIEDCKEDFVDLEDSEYTFLKEILEKVKWKDNLRLFLVVLDNFNNVLPEEETPEDKLVDVDSAAA